MKRLSRFFGTAFCNLFALQKDGDGYTHYWLVGLNTDEVENYGYAEYIKDENGEWVGGYSARASLNSDGKGPEWLEAGKAELGIPW